MQLVKSKNEKSNNSVRGTQVVMMGWTFQFFVSIGKSCWWYQRKEGFRYMEVRSSASFKGTIRKTFGGNVALGSSSFSSVRSWTDDPVMLSRGILLVKETSYCSEKISQCTDCDDYKNIYFGKQATSIINILSWPEPRLGLNNADWRTGAQGGEQRDTLEEGRQWDPGVTR